MTVDIKKYQDIKELFDESVIRLGRSDPNSPLTAQDILFILGNMEISRIAAGNCSISHRFANIADYATIALYVEAQSSNQSQVDKPTADSIDSSVAVQNPVLAPQQFVNLNNLQKK